MLIPLTLFACIKKICFWFSYERKHLLAYDHFFYSSFKSEKSTEKLLSQKINIAADGSFIPAAK